MGKTKLFNDIDKDANDLLSDDFDYTTKLKTKVKAPNGVEVSTESVLSGQGGNKSILAKISGAYKHPSGINFKKLQATTHGRFIGEAEVADVGTKGLKLSFKAEDGYAKNAANKRYGASGKIALEFANDLVSTTAEADLVNNKLATTGLYQYEKILVGVGALFDTEKAAIVDYNVAAGYNASDFTLAVKTKNSLNLVSTSYSHRVNPYLSAAGVITHNLPKQTQSLTIGGKYAASIDTILRAKASSEGILSFAISQKLNDTVKVTAAAEIDVKNLEGDSHRFGLGFHLG